MVVSARRALAVVVAVSGMVVALGARASAVDVDQASRNAMDQYVSPVLVGLEGVGDAPSAVEMYCSFAQGEAGHDEIIEEAMRAVELYRAKRRVRAMDAAWRAVTQLRAMPQAGSFDRDFASTLMLLIDRARRDRNAELAASDGVAPLVAAVNAMTTPYQLYEYGVEQLGGWDRLEVAETQADTGVTGVTGIDSDITPDAERWYLAFLACDRSIQLSNNKFTRAFALRGLASYGLRMNPLAAEYDVIIYGKFSVAAGGSLLNEVLAGGSSAGGKGNALLAKTYSPAQEFSHAMSERYGGYAAAQYECGRLLASWAEIARAEAAGSVADVRDEALASRRMILARGVSLIEGDLVVYTRDNDHLVLASSLLVNSAFTRMGSTEDKAAREDATKQINRAFTYASQVVKKDKTHLEANTICAQLMMQNGMADAARAYVQNMLDSSPDNPDALYLRATISVKLNDVESARKDLQLIIDTSPNHPLAAQARATLSPRK